MRHDLGRGKKQQEKAQGTRYQDETIKQAKSNIVGHVPSSDENNL